jgi:hypothetical protein
MDKTFYKKIIKFQSFLIDNFKIIDEDVTKRNRKINFNHIIYTCFNKFTPENFIFGHFFIKELNYNFNLKIIYKKIFFINYLYIKLKEK